MRYFSTFESYGDALSKHVSSFFKCHTGGFHISSRDFAKLAYNQATVRSINSTHSSLQTLLLEKYSQPVPVFLFIGSLVALSAAKGVIFQLWGLSAA